MNRETSKKLLSLHLHQVQRKDRNRKKMEKDKKKEDKKEQQEIKRIQ